MKVERPVRWVRCIMFCLLLIGEGGIASLEGAERPAFREGRLLIVPRADRAGEAQNLHRNRGRKVRKRFEALRNMEVVELAPGEDVWRAVREYQASGAVEIAEPDYYLRKSVTPNDPFVSSQWHLGRGGGGNDADIDAPEGWEIRHDATNIIVAVVDSGARLTHEDLAPNLWVNAREIAGNGRDDDGNGYVDDVHGINAINGTGNPTDDDGHGTHVAGIIGAAGNNGKGLAGVAWRTQLMPLKFLSSAGDGLTSDAVECINYAIQKGARVINASFGSTNFVFSMQSAIQSARNAGIVFVAAAGNDRLDNDTNPSYPASYPLDNIVSVAATSSANLLDTSYSNYGSASVDLAAPGTSVYSCGNASDSSYIHFSGTSMAAPVVSGVVALMRAQFPTDTPAQIIQRLLGTVDPLPSLEGKCVSGGRVNLEKALSPFVSASFAPSALAGSFPLTVRFTNQSLGEITSYLWDFGDGSAVSTEASPSHVFAGEGDYTVQLRVTGANGQTSATSQTISVLPTYTFKSIAYEWIDPAAMTQLALSDNGSTDAIEIPFPFYFYGTAKTQIYIGANGLAGFDPANLGTTSNTDLPAASTPNGMILPYWDNLNPGSGGAIYAGVTGEAPNRRFLVSWVGVPRNSSANNMTFQAALAETTGHIQFNYREVHPASSRGGGARATIGVEDGSGLVATKYCYDGVPNRVANGQSILFAASASRGLSVTPDSPPLLAGSGTDLRTNRVAFTVKNQSHLPILWTATKTAAWTSLSAEGGALPAGAETTVTVSLNEGVAALAAGTHAETISFVNLNSGQGNTQRSISIEVTGRVAATRIRPPAFQNGEFRLEIPGTIGTVFIIEVSTDLTEWQEAARGIVGVTGALPFTESAQAEARFFRVLVE